jgi:predicted membrane protein
MFLLNEIIKIKEIIGNHLIVTVLLLISFVLISSVLASWYYLQNQRLCTKSSPKFPKTEASAECKAELEAKEIESIRKLKKY